MQHYLAFIAEWAGTGLLVPVMYVFVLAGPFALLVLAGDTRQRLVRRSAIAVATCSFFAYFFICLGTGIYIGKFHGIGGWGIPLGFALFIGSIFLLAWAQNLARKFKRAPSNAKL